MSMTAAAINNAATLNGTTYTQTATVNVDGTTERGHTAVPAPASGTLAVRTSNSVGTLTMGNGSHGIATGNRFDLYWSGGSRRGIIAGTVAGASIPFTLGDGDSLPIATTVIYAQKCIEEALWQDPISDVLVMLLKVSRRATIVLADDSNEVFAKVFSSANAYQWFADSGFDNPMSGAITKVFYTNGDPAGTNSIKVSIGVQ